MNLTASNLASRFVSGGATAPTTSDTGAQLLPTRIKSGKAASLKRGIAHMVAEAAIATDEHGAVLTARWECGGGSINAVPVVGGDSDFATCANCADAARCPRGPVVYRCMAADDSLLYIGSSIDVRTRLRAHAMPGGSEWWADVDRVDFEQYPTEATCRIAEAAAIRSEQPLHNREGVRRRASP